MPVMHEAQGEALRIQRYDSAVLRKHTLRRAVEEHSDRREGASL